MNNNQASDLPYIICHMMTTLDGKITFGKVQNQEVGVPLFTEFMPLYNSTQDKLEGDAWMCGRVTMDEFDEEEKISLDSFKDTKENVEEEFIVKNELNLYAIGIDTKGLLRWKENYLAVDSKNFNLIMIVSKETPKEYLAYLRSKNISYIFGGEKEVNFKDTFRQLKEKFGIQRILLEGGGSINGSVIAEDLINEMSLLLIPIVINNVEAPELFYKQLTMPKLYNFKLQSFEKLTDDILWMRYTKI